MFTAVRERGYKWGWYYYNNNYSVHFYDCRKSRKRSFAPAHTSETLSVYKSITEKRLIIRILTQLYIGIKLTCSTHAHVILQYQTNEWQITRKLEIKHHNQGIVNIITCTNLVTSIARRVTLVSKTCSPELTTVNSGTPRHNKCARQQHKNQSKDRQHLPTLVYLSVRV
jgi:hypothetical protein